VIETDTYQIVGEISLPRDGYRNRFSDLLNQGERHFIPLINAWISPLRGGDRVHRNFLMVGRQTIEFAYELADAPMTTAEMDSLAPEMMLREIVD